MLDTRYVVKWNLIIKNEGPLRIGDGEEGVMLEYEDGKRIPFLPASGITGAFRSYLEQNIGPEGAGTIRALFGIAKNEKLLQKSVKSRLAVRDGSCVFGFDGKLEHRERIEIDGARGVAAEEKKFDTLFLGKGCEFVVEFAAAARDGQEKEAFRRLLEKAFQALQHQELRLGAQKTNGGGIFSIRKIRENVYDLFEPEQLLRYLKDAEPAGEIREEKEFAALLEGRPDTSAITLEAEVVCRQPFLIAGNTEEQAGSREKFFMKNKDGELLIPGSSLKGVLKGQCVKIAAFKQINPKLIRCMFGEGGSQGSRGNIFVSDGVFSEKCICSPVYHGIRLNKFTGGSWLGGKYASHPVRSSFMIRIQIQSLREPERSAAAGLLLFALRDLLQERVTLGGEFGQGFGRMQGDTIVVTDRERITVKLKDPSSNETIRAYFQALDSCREENDGKNTM